MAKKQAKKKPAKKTAWRLASEGLPTKIDDVLVRQEPAGTEHVGWYVKHRRCWMIGMVYTTTVHSWCPISE